MLTLVVQQLLAIWNRAKGKERDAMLWGDEVCTPLMYASGSRSHSTVISVFVLHVFCIFHLLVSLRFVIGRVSRCLP
jgi:hypothetical protein